MSEHTQGRLFDLEQLVGQFDARLRRIEKAMTNPMEYTDFVGALAERDSRMTRIERMLTVLISAPQGASEFRARWQSLPAVEAAYKALEDGALDPASRADLDGAEQLIREAEAFPRL